MHRDDLILRGIADGAASPAALEERTGLTHTTVWRGLHHLQGSGHVFSPARSVYRLTVLGETALSMPGQEPAMPQPADDALADEPRSIAAMDSSILAAQLPQPVQRDADTDHHADDREAERGVAGLAAVAGGFGWGDVVRLVLVFLVLVVAFVLADRMTAVPPLAPCDVPPQPAAFTPPWSNWG